MRTKRLVRRGARRARRPQWVGRLRRLNRALTSSSRMIDSTMEAIERASSRAADCPIHTTRDLHRLMRRLVAASVRLGRSARGVTATRDVCAETTGAHP